MEKSLEKKYRVVVVLSKKERDDLRRVARGTQRSMTGYLRYLLVTDLEYNPDDE